MSVPTSVPEAGHEFERLLVQTIGEIVWSGLVGGAGLAVSGNVHRLCGLTHEQFLRSPSTIWIEQAHQADRVRVEQAFRRLVMTGTPFDEEYRWRPDSGGWLWLHGRAILRPSCDPPIIDAVFVDITERKRLEEQIRQLQKVETAGHFTGGVAHDFNNLLAVILANNTLLRDALEPDDPRRADAEISIDAAQRAAALTRQLLGFSRQHAFDPRILDVNQIIGAAERMLRRIIGADIDFCMRLEPGIANVCADAALLEQVLVNLVMNARDAMPEGGKLSIETSEVTPDSRHRPADAAASARYVRLSVSDTGCGMDTMTKGQVFEPFFTTKPDARRTGLGLSTCHSIVKQAGGCITVDSEPGEGTVFEVLLPVVHEPISVPASGVRTTQTYTGTETILVVEDDDGVRTLVDRMLARLGYQVFCARDAQDTLAILQSCKEPIDLILSDVIMPGLKGQDVVSQVQARSPRTRALFMSGHSRDWLAQQGILAEGTAFIHKPFMPSELASQVREVLDA
jgi:two-component system cell cycle sensor histidine kinase/response regulator CckA